jgi:hypothetical protein
MIEDRREEKGVGLGHVLGFMLLLVVSAGPVVIVTLSKDVEIVKEIRMKGEWESQMGIKTRMVNQDHDSD